MTSRQTSADKQGDAVEASPLWHRRTTCFAGKRFFLTVERLYVATPQSEVSGEYEPHSRPYDVIERDSIGSVDVDKRKCECVDRLPFFAISSLVSFLILLFVSNGKTTNLYALDLFLAFITLPILGLFVSAFPMFAEGMYRLIFDPHDLTVVISMKDGSVRRYELPTREAKALRSSLVRMFGV